MMTRQPSLDRGESERAADPRHDEAAVTAFEHPLQIGAVDLDADKARTCRNVLHRGRKRLDRGHGGDAARIRYAARFGDPDEVGIRSGMARLPAGLAIDLVFEHDDGEI